MKRTFFALDINTKDKNKIDHYRTQQLRLPFKAINKENFHITLSFLGFIDNYKQQQLSKFAHNIAMQLQDISPACLLLDHYGLFKKPKVFYLGLQQQPDWLKFLAHALIDQAKNLNIEQENRLYCPHLSIYRKATLNNLPHYVLTAALPITITSFSLYQSISTPVGVQYHPMKTWRLKTKKLP